MFWLKIVNCLLSIEEYVEYHILMEDCKLSTLHIVFMYEMVTPIRNIEFIVIHILQFVCWSMSSQNYVLSLRKNLVSSREVKPSGRENNISWTRIFNPCMISLATHTIAAEICSYFCNAYPIGYQRTYMRCLVSLQRPKTQRIHIRWYSSLQRLYEHLDTDRCVAVGWVSL